MTTSNQDLSIDFGSHGNSQGFALTGWSVPEATETWAIGTASRIVLPRPSTPAAYVVVLRLRPHVITGKIEAQRLGVTVNGTMLDAFTLTHATTRACVIPWSVVTARPKLEIDFAMPDAARPTNLANSTDSRLLGVAFTSLRLTPDRFGPLQPDEFLARHDAMPIDINAVTVADNLPLHDLMLGFESLGQNCEFGLVQRKSNAEPLGLLRFSSTPLPQLLKALDAGFEGIGAPDNIVVEISPNGREYMVNDRRYGFVYHAWVKTGEMTIAEVHQREVRRVPFLVRKLLEDLAEGEKTFIFKGMGAMLDEQVFPLAMALRRYGDNTLLFVNLSDATHRGGTVEARAPGFLVGYLDRFAPGDDAQDFLLAQWVKLCRQSYRLRMVNKRNVP